MPRPLIIKVETHKSQPNKKATGSIDVQLLKGMNKESMYETYNNETDNVLSVPDDEQSNPTEEIGSRSIVRNLISRYETPTDKATLIKYKSKSLADLQKPQLSIVAKKTQDDFLYNKGRYNEEPTNKKFNFKKVFSKFESSSHYEHKTSVTTPVTPVKTHKLPNYDNDSLDLGGIKQKARVLLEQHQRNHEISSWEDRVVELLKQIEKVGAAVNREPTTNYVNKNEKISVMTYKSENTLQRAKSLDHGQLNKNLKVKDIKNIFEAKIDNTKPLSRSVSSYATYFGLKSSDEDNNFKKLGYSLRGLSATPFNEDFNNNQMESEKSEDSDFLEEDSYEVEFVNRGTTSDVIEGNRIIAQPVLASSMKIRELKNFFDAEPDRYVSYQSYIQNGNDEPEETDRVANVFNNSEREDIHVVENRMLPPPKMVELDNETDGNMSVKNSKQRIEELTKDIQNYEKQIANLSEDSKEEGSYMNEVLIRILLKLDDIKTYGDAIILTERRKAIQFVQNCISKLREKVKGVE